MVSWPSRKSTTHEARHCLVASKSSTHFNRGFCGGTAPGATVKSVATRLGRSIRGMQQTVARLRLVLHGCVERALKQEDRHE